MTETSPFTQIKICFLLKEKRKIGNYTVQLSILCLFIYLYLLTKKQQQRKRVRARAGLPDESSILCYSFRKKTLKQNDQRHSKNGSAKTDKLVKTSHDHIVNGLEVFDLRELKG